MDLTERCIQSQILAQGKLLTVRNDTVALPNGNHSFREYVQHPGAVLVVPVLADGHVVLERQFRYALNQVFVELPAGKLEHSEDPFLAAQRELMEETGYSGGQWIKLGVQHPCIGYSNEIIHTFLAFHPDAGEQQCDTDEFLEVFSISFEAALQMIARGEITDSKTISALFMAQQYLAQQPMVQYAAA